MAIEKKKFGNIDGKDVFVYTLKSSSGMMAEILNFGGIVRSLIVPDKMGKFADVVLGCDSPQDYKKSPYFGSLVGRFANRIALGEFTLDGVDYQLAANNGKNHLHGGLKGFDKKIWNAEAADTPDGSTLKLAYTSSDGEENYPGTLACTVIYTLTDNMELKIEYKATTNKPTIVNLTNHSYFNLAGHNTDNILDHEIQINSNNVTGINENLIPTGSIESILGTSLDLTEPAR
ncbi:MAG: galactose mutarotase, partial [Phycisphaerae bacterium]|nr:galactose mutarotase [Phycisphaerae bacterium]